MANSSWRYFAQRLDRQGGLVPLDWNLPVSSPSISDVLSAPPGLEFTIEPEILRLQGPDNLPIFKRWSTAIFAEDERGTIQGGGIVDDITVSEGGRLNVSCVGYTGYANGTPFLTSRSWVGVDPLDVFRYVWLHIQAQDNQNLGIEVDDTKSTMRIGKKLEQVEFDTQAGPVSFEAGPVQLRWWEEHDLGAYIDDLASENNFDWHEEHWWDGDKIKHFIRLGVPTLGRRREGLRFVYGENVFSTGDLSPAGDYANAVMLLGRGEGRTMKRGEAYIDDGAMRRWAVIEDKVQNTTNKAVAAAKREVARRKGVWSVDEVTVLNTQHAPLGSYKVGDEIFVAVKEGRAHVETWFRVLSIAYSPEQQDVARLTIQRSDTVV